MTKAGFPSHLTIPDSRIRPEPSNAWELIREGLDAVVVEDGGVIPGWDSALRFDLRRRLRISENWHADLGFRGAGARYCLVTRLSTARGLSSIVADMRSIEPVDGAVIDIVVRPDSRSLASDIKLAVSIVLAAPGAEASPLAPVRAGARLWEDRWSARIEGGKTRLPFELVSFSQAFQGRDIGSALFHVEAAEYPELEFEQAVCVYLNTDFPHFVRAIELFAPAETAILWDGVLRRLISAGMGPAFAAAIPWPENSFGAQVETWLATVFPAQDRDSINRFRAAEPSLFEARIQSWGRVAAILAPASLGVSA